MRKRYERLYTLADAIRSDFKPLEDLVSRQTKQQKGLMSQSNDQQNSPVAQEDISTMWKKIMRGED